MHPRQIGLGIGHDVWPLERRLSICVTPLENTRSGGANMRPRGGQLQRNALATNRIMPTVATQNGEVAATVRFTKSTVCHV